MTVVQLQTHQMAIWDEFVAGHPLGGLFHQSQWRDVLEKSYPHMKAHFLCLLDPKSGKIIAGLPLYEVKSWIFGKRLVSVPYSSWCDPLVSDDAQLKLLLDGALELGNSLSSKRIELRFREVRPDVPSAGWSVRRPWKLHSVPLARAEDEVWSNISRTAVRRLVRKAERDGIEVAAEIRPESIGEFYGAFVATRQRLGLPVVPVRYFAAIRECLSDRSRTLLVARREGRFLGAVLALKAQGVFHLEFAAATCEAKHLGVMQLLYWRALQLAISEGWSEFSFGRTAVENTGLIAYKRHWDTLEEDLPVYIWSNTGKGGAAKSIPTRNPLLNRILRATPQPLSKLFGTFVYGHWG